MNDMRVALSFLIVIFAACSMENQSVDADGADSSWLVSDEDSDSRETVDANSRF